MMVFTLICLIAGIALLALGYKKDNRNLLLSGALVLFISAAGPDFVTGFAQGWTDARGTSAQR